MKKPYETTPETVRVAALGLVEALLALPECQAALAKRKAMNRRGLPSTMNRWAIVNAVARVWHATAADELVDLAVSGMSADHMDAIIANPEPDGEKSP